MSRNIYSLSNFFLQQIPKLPSVRLYGRWMHRRPAKVLLPFEPNSNVNLKEEHVIDIGAEGFKKSNENYESKEKKPPAPVTSQEKFKEIKAKKEMELKKKKFYLSQKKVFDDNGDVIYEKLKGNDGRIRLVYLTVHLILFYSNKSIFFMNLNIKYTIYYCNYHTTSLLPSRFL